LVNRNRGTLLIIKTNNLKNPVPAPVPARRSSKIRYPVPVTGDKFQFRPGSGSGQNFISGETLVLCGQSAGVWSLDEFNNLIFNHK
jgi:hypothetical protein